MHPDISDRVALQEQWRIRVRVARRRLDSARNRLNGIQRDFARDIYSAPENQVIYKQAIRAESAALTEYARVLEIYSRLVLDGIPQSL